MKKVNVCVLAPSYPTKTEPYGAFFIRDQAVALKKLGCKVSVVSPRIFGRGSTVSTVDSIQVYNFSFLTKNKRLSEFKKLPIIILASYLISGTKKLFKVVRQQRCNIIHAHWAVPSGFIAILVGKYLLKKPVILTVHGSDIMVFSKRNKISQKIVKFVLKKADHIISVNNLMRNTIISEFNITEQKIASIKLGIDLKIFKSKSQKEARSKLRLQPNKTIILYVGGLDEIKGLNYLIEAVPEVLHQHPDSILLLIGEGTQKENLEEQISKLGVKDFVKFLGSKPHHEIANWMNAADIFVLPSLSEGLPVTIMEAIALGLPVVATGVGGTPEILEDKKNGFLVEPQNKKALAEKINALLADKLLVEKIKRACIKKAPSFDAGKYNNQILKIYQSLIK